MLSLFLKLSIDLKQFFSSTVIHLCFSKVVAKHEMIRIFFFVCLLNLVVAQKLVMRFFLLLPGLTIHNLLNMF